MQSPFTQNFSHPPYIIFTINALFDLLNNGKKLSPIVYGLKILYIYINGLTK